MSSPLTRRRTIAWLALSACTLAARGEARAFHGIDVSGAPFGRRLELDDPKGCLRRLSGFRAIALRHDLTAAQVADDFHKLLRK